MTNHPPFAAILIRGPAHVQHEILDTLHFLRLRKKHACIIIPNTPTTKGMLERCKNYITWGEIQPETLQALTAARGQPHHAGAAPPSASGIPKEKRKPTTEPHEATNTPQHFSLHPPRGGFERKGIKAPYATGGSLGYRGDAINSLIKRML